MAPRSAPFGLSPTSPIIPGRQGQISHMPLHHKDLRRNLPSGEPRNRCSSGEVPGYSSSQEPSSGKSRAPPPRWPPSRPRCGRWRTGGDVGAMVVLATASPTSLPAGNSRGSRHVGQRLRRGQGPARRSCWSKWDLGPELAETAHSGELPGTWPSTRGPISALMH